MAWGEGIRLSIGANELKRAINEVYGIKFKAIAKDAQVKRELATMWAEQVSRFVPRSNLPDDVHHLQKYYVSDGRVTWYRYNKNGDDITQMLYEGTGGRYFGADENGEQTKEKKYGYHFRPDSPYQPHEPRAYWDQAVRPGGTDWDTFLMHATDLLTDTLADQIK